VDGLDGLDGLDGTGIIVEGTLIGDAEGFLVGISV